MSARIWAPAFLVGTLCAGASSAETLFDAVRLAYDTSPALRAQRAQLRQTDEAYVQARAGLGPQVGLSGQATYENARVDQGASIFSKAGVIDYHAGTISGDLSIVQPVYSSGSVSAQIHGASANILAGREDLRQSESQLVVNVITAYLDVRHDRMAIKVLEDEVEALTRDFAEIKAKGAAGQLTRTDVAESESRLLAASAQLDLARGHLEASDAEYLNVVGQSPGDLAEEPDLPGLPERVDDAFDAAERNNAQLMSAIQTERSARARVDAARAANGATVSLRLDAAAAPVDPYLARQYDKDLSVSATFNQPLFTSGLNSSKIREALARENQAQFTIENTRRGVVQQISRAWGVLVSTRRAIAVQGRQIETEQAAVVGNRIEERAGSRSTFELMNAESELTNARLGLLQSRHDEYLARATVVAAMGLLEARYLTPGAELYDPRTALDRARRVGAVPWEGAVERLDSLGAPRTAAPGLSGPRAGGQRPTDLPPAPPSTQ